MILKLIRWEYDLIKIIYMMSDYKSTKFRGFMKHSKFREKVVGKSKQKEFEKIKKI